MLKGCAKIELTNKETGEKRVIEENNMVTNGFSQFFKSFFGNMPARSEEYHGSSDTYMGESFFGGLMLFDKTLEEDADNLIIPTDVNCVGYGSDLANNSTNLKCGTFNKTESEIKDGTFKFVWDFTTNQANGLISSLSLVPRVAGILGWNTTAEEYSNDVCTNNKFKCGELKMPTCDMILYFDDDYLYCVKKYNLSFDSSHAGEHISRTGKMVIQKFRMSNRIFGLTTILNSSATNVSTNILEEEIVIEVPSDFLEVPLSDNYFLQMCNYDNGYIYLIMEHKTKSGAFTFPKNSSLKICRIDTNDYSTKVFTVTNNSDDVTWGNYYSYDADTIQHSLRVVNGKIIISAFDSKQMIVDIENPLDAKPITIDGEAKLVVSLGCCFDKYIFTSYKRTLYEIYSYVINTETGHGYVLNNLYGTYFSSIYAYNVSISKNGAAPHKDNPFYKISNENCFTMIPYVLMTINNLSTPITKTSAQTMKITYTITEV